MTKLNCIQNKLTNKQNIFFKNFFDAAEYLNKINLF